MPTDEEGLVVRITFDCGAQVRCLPADGARPVCALSFLCKFGAQDFEARVRNLRQSWRSQSVRSLQRVPTAGSQTVRSLQRVPTARPRQVRSLLALQRIRPHSVGTRVRTVRRGRSRVNLASLRVLPRSKPRHAESFMFLLRRAWTRTFSPPLHVLPRTT